MVARPIRYISDSEEFYSLGQEGTCLAIKGVLVSVMFMGSLMTAAVRS